MIDIGFALDVLDLKTLFSLPPLFCKPLCSPRFHDIILGINSITLFRQCAKQFEKKESYAKINPYGRNSLGMKKQGFQSLFYCRVATEYRFRKSLSRDEIFGIFIIILSLTESFLHFRFHIGIPITLSQRGIVLSLI